MRYLFHSIYGDAAELVRTAPVDVTCIKSGGDPSNEKRMRDKLVEIGSKVSISALPSLIYFIESHQRRRDGATVDVPGRWSELRVADLPKPWTWTQIDAELAKGTDMRAIKPA